MHIECLVAEKVKVGLTGVSLVYIVSRVETAHVQSGYHNVTSVVVGTYSNCKMAGNFSSHHIVRLLQ